MADIKDRVKARAVHKLESYDADGLIIKAKKLQDDDRWNFK